MDEEFDKLYRKHLSNVYEILKEDVPDYLHIPIKSEETRPVREPTNIIRPVIDGLVTDYYEWLEAGSFDTEEAGGTMHRSQGMVKRIYYGFDLERLYMRFDITGMENGNSETILLALVVSPSDMRIEIPIYPRRFPVEAALMKKDSHDNWGVLKNIKSVAFDEILEIGLNFSDLNICKGQEIFLKICLEEEGKVLERCPHYGAIRIIVPSEDYALRHWIV
ncbi:MAG: hypothetical protein HYV48_00255 [Candidatus Omnitrophica bacterium]|nr:hypothetical protein [Candidatus Omnitrophota bacterium]